VATVLYDERMMRFGVKELRRIGDITAVSDVGVHSFRTWELDRGNYHFMIVTLYTFDGFKKY
jgi:hypothetical protein